MEPEIYWNQTKIILVGKTKVGKTSLQMEFINASRKAKDFSCIALDPNFEFHRKLGLKPIRDSIKNVRPNTTYQTSDTNVKILNQWITMSRCFPNQLLICDDIDQFLAGTGACPDRLKDLMSGGRHQNLGCIFTAKRLIGLPKPIFQNADYIAIFNMGPTVDKEIADYKTVFKDLDAVKDLPKYKAILYEVQNSVAVPIGIIHTKPM